MRESTRDHSNASIDVSRGLAAVSVTWHLVTVIQTTARA